MSMITSTGRIFSRVPNFSGLLGGAGTAGGSAMDKLAMKMAGEIVLSPNPGGTMKKWREI